MQRLFLLLSVTVLLLAGCGGKGDQVTEMQNVETESQAVVGESEDSPKESEPEEAVTEEPETETVEEPEPEESAAKEDSRSEDGGSNGQPSAEQKPEQETQKPDEKQSETTQPQTTQQEPEQPLQPEQPAQPEPVSYSPERVVQLATEKTKADGKIYIPDDLDRMLAEGLLTQEDYNACYPTDGAGYLEFYVAADLNEARDVSGTVKFNSEDDIAANIAGMYHSLPQQYFYIEYHGTVMYGGKECYVFYCYRA